MSSESARLKAFLETKEQEYEQKIKKEKKRRLLNLYTYSHRSPVSPVLQWLVLRL